MPIPSTRIRHYRMVSRVASDEWIAQHGYVRAEVTLLTTAEGGRRSGVSSGYRSSWHFGERNSDNLMVMHDAPLELEIGAHLELGATALVRLYPLHPEYWGSIQPGTEVTMYEGTRQVGRAKIIEVVAPGT